LHPDEQGPQMKTSPGNDLNAVCTVIEMARRLQLSRARFYQLLKIGAFPPPVYSIRTRRPLYPLDLQQMCIAVRKTGIGLNGQPLLFNTPRTTNLPRPRSQIEPHYNELSERLKQLDLIVPPNEIKKAVKVLYPGGLPKDRIDGSVVGDLFRYLRSNRQRSV